MQVHGKQSRKLLIDDHDAVSHFIWCIRKRPPLYNYKLPAEQRRRVDVARIWQEVADEIGNVSAADCRKKWKNLRDTYHQYRLRKMKYKECLEKWRYTKDLEFLTNIYQPKLKSERAEFLKTSFSNTSSSIQEVKTSDISSLIELDEEDNTQDNESFSKDIIMHQNESAASVDFDDENIEHIELNEMPFSRTTRSSVKTVDAVEDTYEEVFLYDDTNVVDNVDDLIIESKDDIVKKSTSPNKSMGVLFESPIASQSQNTTTPSDILTIGNKKDELDLFFQFLKTKIQNLPSVDITAIQIEFLNAVLRREAAHLEKTSNTNTL
ncbi:uncharacterized protein LOC129911390 [Episyrphus balteatus]|uniref:uncharacterized protein LOC129911390 n=1 Tax=Episyrphus balteatus TaxID=286459 RepID=UPI002485BC28|nr:uncharacterized protein LOC129911390 [Episyrphus balteatus]